MLAHNGPKPDFIFFIFWTTILRNSFSIYNSLGEKNLNTIKGFPPAETHSVPDGAEGLK